MFDRLRLIKGKKKNVLTSACCSIPIDLRAEEKGGGSLWEFAFTVSGFE